MEQKRENRSHYKVLFSDVLVEKKGYPSERDALRAAFIRNTKPETIHKFVAYKCSKCGAWHIGKNSTVLTDDMREEYKRKLVEYGK